MVVKNGLRWVAYAVQMHTSLVIRILPTHYVRRWDRDGVLPVLGHKLFKPRAFVRCRTADKHGNLEERLRIGFGMVGYKSTCKRGALREAHHAIKGALLLDDVESVLECSGEVFSGVNVAGVVAVERAVQNAFDFCDLG